MDVNSYRALKESAAWIDLTGRGKIRVTGEDRVRLMHAMCTNHVQNLQPGAGCYAFFLTAQGRILADANVYCMPDYLLLDTEPEARARVMEHLEKYIIADDVTLHDFTEATATISVEGPESERILTALDAAPGQLPLTIVEIDPMTHVAHWSYTGGPGYVFFIPVEAKPEWIAKLTAAGIPQADMETADAVRIGNVRPRWGVEFSDANIPQETGQMQAIHFSKGCYLGQEIVERVRSRGHVNRVLTGVEIRAAEAPPRGAKVLAGDKEVGEVLSTAVRPGDGNVIGFALVRAEALADAASLSVNGAELRPRAA